jgi:CheY-like chemotaxis protein
MAKAIFTPVCDAVGRNIQLHGKSKLMVALEGNVSDPITSSPAKAFLAILLTEDSLVTQDLLKLILTQRGHGVDIADDSEKALSALQDRRYDIALMDFHLPKMDGLRAVMEFTSRARGTVKLPYFIGITADIEGLLAHPDNCEAFDLVIAKPLDLVSLCSVVENCEHYMAWTRSNATDRGVSQPVPVVLAHDGERRVHKRIKVERGTTVIALRNGGLYDCQVLDLSLSGAALQLEARPAIGEHVRVGRTEGRVVRHTNEGVAVEFANVPRLTATRKF